MANVKFDDLLGSGAHFGHVTRKWDPNFSPYIISEKNGVHIIDLDSTIDAVDKAAKYVKKTSIKNTTKNAHRVTKTILKTFTK